MDRFKSQFPPPQRAVELGIEDVWPVVQRRIGSVLPRDYKDFINTYGTVLLYDFLKPYNPFSKKEYSNLLWQMGAVLSAYRELKAQRGCPYALWFEADGLLPWADTCNGDTLFWLTKGHPDQWTIVLNKSRDPEFEEFDGSMVEFVDAFMNRTLDERFEMTDFDDEPSVKPNL
jgi:hypothetical protein